MERAQSFEILSGPLQMNVIAHHIDNVRRGLDLGDFVFSKYHFQKNISNCPDLRADEPNCYAESTIPPSARRQTLRMTAKSRSEGTVDSVLVWKCDVIAFLGLHFLGDQVSYRFESKRRMPLEK